jgi:hypothetical protein
MALSGLWQRERDQGAASASFVHTNGESRTTPTTISTAHLENRTMPATTTNESTLRSRAKRQGYALRKSPTRNINLDDFGEYMLVDDQNCVVLGGRFDATLEDIEMFLN